jgi:hypothetical protein
MRGALLTSAFSSLMPHSLHAQRISRSTYASREQREEAAAAIRHMRTNALPLLLIWATPKPSQLRPKIGSFLLRCPYSLTPAALRRWAGTRPGQTRANEARLGFMILDADAAPAIPELARLATNSTASYENSAWAISTLGNIGPQAFPALLTVILNSGTASRSAAIHQIAKFGTNALPALLVLIGLLNDSNAQVTCSSAVAIGDLGLSPDISVPALTKCLHRPHRPDPRLRMVAAGALRKFGSAAHVAIPELQKAISEESDPFAKRTLQLILRDLEKAATGGHRSIQI